MALKSLRCRNFPSWWSSTTDFILQIKLKQNPSQQELEQDNMQLQSSKRGPVTPVAWEDWDMHWHIVIGAEHKKHPVYLGGNSIV